MTRSDRRRSSVVRSQPALDQVADVLRESQKLITLGRLTASIAHEINNPLEAVTNLLYLVEQDKSESTHEYLRMAQLELARVAQITRQTLTFSRETKAPMRIELSELIEEVLGLYMRRISDKMIRIARRYETREQVLVLPGEMRQVLSNLISNAIEASAAHGHIVLRIRESSFWSAKGSERGIRFSVGDNGSGIPEDVRRQLGQPFFTTKGQSGTGLGLWVTQSILNRYGSNLQVRSSVDPERQGTVFSFVLPLRLAPVQVIGGGDAEESLGGGMHGRYSHGPHLVAREASGSDEESMGTEELKQTGTGSPRLRACGD